MNTENLKTLKIHKLSQEQYDRELAAGNIDPNALYLTPDDGVDLSEYATLDQLAGKESAIYKQPEAPEDALEGALWLDTDEESGSVSGSGSSGGNGGAVSWNNLINKPTIKVGSPDTFVWTPITEEEVDPSKLVGTDLYIVSEAVITADDLSQGGKLVGHYGENFEELEFTADDCTEMAPGIYILGETIYFVTEEGHASFGTTFPKVGIYFNINLLNVNLTLTINGYKGFAKEVIDPEYLPEILPEITEETEGAFLRVVDGKASWQVIPYAEGVGF